jgi:hypothetical protein
MGVVIKIKVPRPSGMVFKVERTEYESCYEAVLVTLHKLRILNAELNNKQFMKFT